MSDKRDFVAGPPFLDLYAAGALNEDDIDDYITCRHRKALRGEQSLNEFLGMTWAEYGRWMTEDSALDRIVEARRTRAVATSEVSHAGF